jgi:hypothetical protein
MNIDESLNQVRPLFKLAGTVLITVALLKLFGVGVGIVPGDHWQIALVGLACTSW